jgi:hypothetical protein
MMKTVKLKYDTRISDRLYLAGSEISVPSPEEFKIVFPSLEYRSDSRMIAVKFPGISRVTFLAASQVIVS